MTIEIIELAQEVTEWQPGQKKEQVLAWRPDGEREDAMPAARHGDPYQVECPAMALLETGPFTPKSNSLWADIR